MFCISCGTQFSDDSQNCPNCGAAASRGPQPTSAAYVPGASVPSGGGRPGVGWIVCLKVTGWILFAASIITGFVMAIPVMKYQPGYGMLLILGGIFTGFLTVAGLMVFLNIANDISMIRHHLENKNED